MMYKISDRFQRIILEIQNNPGIRFSELMRNCGLSNGTMTHYVNKLEKLKTVKIRRNSRECRFFANSIHSLEKAVIVALRKKSQREILLLLIKKDHPFSDICKTLRLAPSTISVKLKELVKSGIIEHKYCNKSKIYGIRDTEIRETIKKYQNIIKTSEP